jgi:hypothetical protein
VTRTSRPIDFETDADVVGLTGYVIHKKRMFEIIAEFRRRGKFVVVGGPFASLCPEGCAGGRRDLRGRGGVHVAAVLENWRAGGRRIPAGRKPSMLDSPLPRFDL